MNEVDMMKIVSPLLKRKHRSRRRIPIASRAFKSHDDDNDNPIGSSRRSGPAFRVESRSTRSTRSGDRDRASATWSASVEQGRENVHEYKCGKEGDEDMVDILSMFLPENENAADTVSDPDAVTVGATTTTVITATTRTTNEDQKQNGIPLEFTSNVYSL